MCGFPVIMHVFVDRRHLTDFACVTDGAIREGRVYQAVVGESCTNRNGKERNCD